MILVKSEDVVFGLSQYIRHRRILDKPFRLFSKSDLNAQYSFGAFSRLWLLLLLGALSFSAIVSSSASMDVKLSIPQGIDLCEPEVYSLVVSSDEQVEDIFATVELPEGLSYSGGSWVTLAGLRSECEPSLQGRSARWDLSSSLRSCRHVVINELEQNPKGPDQGKEWIELYNPTSSEVKIGGWQLVDSYYRKTLTLSQDASISPGGHKTVAWTNGSLVNSRAASLCLYDSSGKTVDCTPSVVDEEDDDRCWARSPNGKDMNTDLDWAFQASTAGSSNGGRGYDLYPGESLTLEFLLTAGCSARCGQHICAEVFYKGSSSSVQSPILDIKRANLSLSCIPDKFEAAKGDEVSWRIFIKNDGNGTAHNILVNASLSRGLELLSSDSPGGSLSWRYDSLGPAEETEVELHTKILSSSDYYYSLINASWGCGPCQVISQKSEIGRRTSVRKQPDSLGSFAIGEDVDFLIEADLPSGGARGLWINDSLPPGLIYKADSFYCKGSRLKKEVLDIAGGESSEIRICWFFEDEISSSSIEIGYSATVANTPENQNGLQLEGGKACMACDGLNADCDEAGDLILAEPDLVLEAKASSSAGDIGNEITYTLSVFHSSSSSSTAFDVDIQDVLPSGLSYSPGSAAVLSGPPATFDNAELKWHFDSMDLSWDAGHKVLLRYNATISKADPGDAFENNASLIWSSLASDGPEERDGSGGVNDYIRMASSQIDVIRLSISKLANPDPVSVGEPLTYTLTYENQGAVAARNVTIVDELDPNLLFISSNPPCNAGNSTWKIPLLMPDGPHSIEINALVDETVANGTRLVNRFSIESDEISPVGNTIYTDILNGSRLDINKTAIQKAVRRGEEVAYIIRICNHGGRSATNVSVRDVFDSHVELIYASPPFRDGTWNFDALEPGECIELGLIVRVPREDVEFTSHQEIKGNGFVRISGDYTTSLKPYVLTNKVFVISDEGPILSDTEEVTVIGEAGTDLKIREHGSGSYENRERLRYLSSNKSLELEKLLEAHHQPIDFQLQGNRSERFASRWSELVHARNGITGSSFVESYRHVVSLDSEDNIHLDENGSKISLVSDFQGPAHFGISKKGCGCANHECAKGAEDIFDSKEDYAGSFRVHEKIREQGRNVISEESVSGAGYASVDKRVWNSQRSYEAGTGPLHLEETIQSSTGFLSKKIDVHHSVVSYPLSPNDSLISSQEWKEGLWARGDISFLGEKYFSIEHLKKEAVLRGVNELESEANFSGRAEFRVAYKDEKNESTELDITDEFAGEYNLTRRVLLAGVSKYNEPHLSIYLADHSDLTDSSILRYTITVKNDGNSALGPIYLRDLFPPGTEYIGSSVGPSELASGYANWTMLSLGIGGSSTIDLKLNVTEDMESLVNRIEAVGGYDGRWVTAENFSVIQLSWLPCCQSDLLVSKEAVLESGTKDIVDYRITLHNPWNYAMAASVADRLPDGMRLINSSLQPSEFDTNRITWMIIDLPPGQTKIIEYKAKAQQKGVLVNRARVDVYAVGGADAATAEVSAEIEVSGGKSGDVGGWKVPECFELNHSAPCAGDGLAAYYSCSDPTDRPAISCASCISPEQEP